MPVEGGQLETMVVFVGACPRNEEYQPSVREIPKGFEPATVVGSVL